MLDMLLGRNRLQASELTDPRYWAPMYQDTATTAGQTVTPEGSMNVSAVYACVKILAESVAGLPCITYRRRADGGKERAQQFWLYSVLHDQPNSTNTAFEFWELAMRCLTLRGNFLAEVNWNTLEMEAILPDQIRAADCNVVDGKKRLRYEVETDNRGPRVLGADSVLHVRGMNKNGFWGCSPITLLRNAIGVAMGAEELAAKQFANGIAPSGVFEHPSKLSDPAFARLQTSLKEHAGSGNARNGMILEEGMKWSQVSLSNEDAQFLESRKMQLEEIARPFRVPLHMLQSLDRATFSNIEHMAIEFVTHTLRPWLVRIEQAIKRDLIYNRDTYFVEFLTDGLLRGDIVARYQAYQVGIQNEFLSSNEVRERENMNPREGGDEYKNPAINPKQTGTNGENAGTSDDESGTNGEDDRNELDSGGNVSSSARNATRQIAAAFAKDLANRFAERELHQLQKRAKHAASDRGKFNEWVHEFYQNHAQYVDQHLGGLCEALDVRTMDRMATVERLSKEQAVALRDGNPEQLSEQWSANLAKQHYQTLMELVT